MGTVVVGVAHGHKIQNRLPGWRIIPGWKISVHVLWIPFILLDQIPVSS